jgi:hypothetical protein
LYKYNVYRDNELIETEYQYTTYYDMTFDPTQPHTWCIKRICEDGATESFPACMEMEKCSCDPVQNLTAVYTEDCDVQLTWDEAIGKAMSQHDTDQTLPEGFIPRNTEKGGGTSLFSSALANGMIIEDSGTNTTANSWIKWNNGVNGDGIGLTSGGTFHIGARFLPADLAANDVNEGDILTKVRFYPYQTTGTTFELKIYQGGTSPNNPGTLKYSQAVTGMVAGQFNETILTTPYVIDASQELWICFMLTHPGGVLPGGLDPGPHVPNKGDILELNGAWSTLWVEAGFDGNWMIDGYVEVGNPNLPAAPNPFTVTPLGTQLRSKLQWTNPTTTIGGAPLTSISKIVVERDGQPLTQFTSGVTPGQNMSYNDNAIPDAGQHCYSVYAVNSEGNGAKATNCAIFGAVCEYDINITYVHYGDDFNWSLIGESGTVYFQQGNQFGGMVSVGHFTALIPENCNFKLWQASSWNYGDNGVTLTISVNGEVVYTLSKDPIPIGFTTGDVPLECNLSMVTYNIYRDGELIEEMWPSSSYLDNTNNTWEEPFCHTYTVKVVCLNGKESPGVDVEVCQCPYLGGVSGIVTDCVTGLPVHDVNLVLEYKNLPYTTDGDGYYEYPYVNCNKFWTIFATKYGYFDKITDPFFIECQEDIIFDFCIEPVPQWHVFGDVRGCEDTYIEGAKVTLDGYPENEYVYNYETYTDALGRFDFPNVYLNQGDELYAFKIEATGWETHESDLSVKGHTNMGRVILYDIPVKPKDAKAVENPNHQSVEITWTKATLPPVGGGQIFGYKLWRLEPGQENDETLWGALTNEPVDAAAFIDYAWMNYTPGTYKYAVKTAYCMDLVSEPIFSNELTKNIEVPYTIAITTNSGASPLGAVVKLSNTNYTYELISTNNGCTFPKVWLGTYNLTITLEGYTPHTESIEITATSTHEVVLEEIINNPFDLNVDVTGEDCVAKATWKHEPVVAFNGFTIYLNGEAVKTGVKIKEYVFMNLPFGDYTVGVVANYGSGDSEAATKAFSIGCNSIIDANPDYNVYPNPATDIIIVQRANACEATIDIYNAIGMHISSYQTGETHFEINVASFSAGTYFIRINEDEKTTVKSFVKKQ